MLNAGGGTDPSAPDYWPGSRVDSGADSGSDVVHDNCSAESETGAECRFGVVHVQVLSVTAEAEDKMSSAATASTPATTAASRTSEATTLRTIKISPAGKSPRQKDEPLILTQLQVNFWPEEVKTVASTEPPQPRLFYKLLQDVRQILRKLQTQEVPRGAKI